MKGAYLIIAGKAEGFEYKDGYFIRVDDYANINPTVESLRHGGYKVFIIARVVDRIDEFITEEKQ